jgi:LmbE family N-acetylglucosaminyl deacetylase
VNVVVIAPHPDDEAIGCGGAMCLHADRGDRVVTAFLTSGERGIKGLDRDAAWRIREAEAAAAAAILGAAGVVFLRQPDYDLSNRVDEAAGALAAVLARERPELLYLPHPSEWHPDHRAAGPIARKALRSAGSTARLRLYEVWTPLAEYDDGEDITAVMARKLRAVRAYESQVGQLRYDRGVCGLNKYRGALAWGCRYAEVFQTAGAGADETGARSS